MQSLIREYTRGRDRSARTQTLGVGGDGAFTTQSLICVLVANEDGLSTPAAVLQVLRTGGSVAKSQQCHRPVTGGMKSPVEVWSA